LRGHLHSRHNAGQRSCRDVPSISIYTPPVISSEELNTKGSKRTVKPFRDRTFSSRKVATLSTSSHSLKSANQLLFSSVFVIDSHKSVSWPSSWASSADMVEFEAVVCTCEAVIGVIFPGKFACGNEFKDSVTVMRATRSIPYCFSSISHLVL
jgi:hypothetical protein